MSKKWYFNASPKALGKQGTSYNIGFTSGAQHFTILRNGTVFKEKFYLYYNDTEAYKSGWKQTAFRTVEFDEEPTGALLTYLEANATAIQENPYKFKRFYQNERLIGSGTYKFRPYTAIQPQTIFNITNVLSNVTANGENPMTIAKNDSATLVYTAASGYKLPSSVTVTNAVSSWNQSTGVLNISNPTGDITVIITAVTIPRYTVTMNLTNMTFLPNVTTIKEGDSQTYELTATSGYTVPAKTAVTVTNATLSTYVAITSSKATMTISNPTGNVTIKADAIKDIFNIVGHLTNVTANGDNPSTIAANDSVTLTYTANSGYTLPDSITVTGATYTYNKTAGTVNISNPTNDVSIIIVGIKIGYDQTVYVGDDIDCSSLPYDDNYNIESSNINVATAENDGGVWRATAIGVGEATISIIETTLEGSVIKGNIRVLVKAVPSYTVNYEISGDAKKGIFVNGVAQGTLKSGVWTPSGNISAHIMNTSYSTSGTFTNVKTLHTGFCDDAVMFDNGLKIYTADKSSSVTIESEKWNAHYADTKNFDLTSYLSEGCHLVWDGDT